MESIYFEKQEGSLCAQHCLNALLQGPIFTAVDLAMHAQNLDEEERQRMAESGIDSDEYKKFIQQPSGNMDDSGYFSVQVISSCLSVWNLELVRYGRTDDKAVSAQSAPECVKAYICNYKDHWFTVRKLAHQWFNLNSCSSGPKLISDTYLEMFLAQLQQEGYSIFVVIGELPQCNADQVLKVCPVVQTEYKNGETKGPECRFPGKGYRLCEGAATSSSEADNDEAAQLNQAVALSLAADAESSVDPDLREAIALSLKAAQDTQDSNGASSLSKPSSLDSDSEKVTGTAEDTELKEALQISLQAEMRRKRLAYLEKKHPLT